MLPESTTSVATATDSGSLMLRVRVWVMRRFAWCGMKASRSSTETPAASSASCATSAIAKGAQRKTAVPSICTTGSSSWWPPRQLGVWVMTCACEPSEPQAVGPMPVASAGPTTTAPAPSAKMNAVPRSVGSMKRLSCSTPMTRTYVSAPERTIEDARLSAWQKPAQPAETSKAAVVEPSRVAICGADAGVCSGCVEVATMTQPSWSARHAGHGEGTLGGGRRHGDEGLVRPGEASGPDPRPGLDPLVVGVQHLADLVVRDDPLGAVDPQAEHRCVGQFGGLLDRHVASIGRGGRD